MRRYSLNQIKKEIYYDGREATYWKVTISPRNRIWDPQDIYDLQKRIEKQKYFKGFLELHFVGGQDPKIIYTLQKIKTKLKQGKTNEN